MQKGNWLLDYRKDVTSQWGEDGVLEKVFSLIKEGRNNWCCEFGAYDGKQFSNTWNLIANKGWSSVLIEADNRRFERLKKEHGKRKGKIHFINTFVTFSGKDSLDNILKKTSIPKDFDLLSVDIDGNDYHIWDSLRVYKPKVVIIEFNCTMPPTLDFVQAKDMNVRHGSSILSFTKLAKRKGYELIYAQDGNAIFVLRKYFPLFNISDNSLEAIYTDRKCETRLYQLYDGTIKIDGWTRLNWHGVDLEEKKVQALPRYLRGFDDSVFKTFGILTLRALRLRKPYLPWSEAFNKKKIKNLARNVPVNHWKK